MANLKEFSLHVTGTAASKIKISSTKRFFLDDVIVTKLSAGQVEKPAVSAPSLVAFSNSKVNVKIAKEVAIKGTNLTSDLTVAVAGEGFSCDDATVGKDEAAEKTLLVNFLPTESKEYEGTLTISGGGLEENIKITLKGKGIVLQGDGTKENPYTVADMIALENPKTTAWVKGVIVGYVYGQNFTEGASFGVAGNVSETNILLADNASETNPEKCVPVQLPSGEIRDAVNLYANPNNLGATLTINGTLEAYFSVAGLKSPKEFEIEGAAPLETFYYKKVDAVQSGKAYLLVASVDGALKVARPLSADKKYGYLSVSEQTEESGQIGLHTTANGFVLTAVDGGYTIKASDERYLYQAGEFDSFNVAAEPAEGQVWSVELNVDGTFKITNLAVTKYIQYTSDNDNYGSYAEEKGVMPYLYELVDGSSVSEVLSEENAPVEVYTLDGVKAGNSLDGLKRGIYIVKQGSKTRKVIK